MARPKADFRIKRGDLRPFLEAQLENGDGTNPDISGLAVVFNMKTAAGIVKVSRQTAIVVDGPSAKVRYEWASADTNTKGLFHGEFEVTFPSAKPSTFPNGKHILIDIYEDIA